MNIVVCGKMVPDLAEDLEIAENGTDLDRSALRYVLNEFDDQALEQALLLKEAHGGTLVVVASGGEGVEEPLFTALAKGADRAIAVAPAEGASARATATALAEAVRGLAPDLILTGVQAADDREGQLGMLMAGLLDLPHAGVVTGVELDPAARTALVRKEFAGGLTAELELTLPAVVGIQAASRPPRYAPVSKIRQAMKERQIERRAAGASDRAAPGAPVRRLLRPVSTQHAQMLAGPPEAVAEQLVAILQERSLLRK